MNTIARLLVSCTCFICLFTAVATADEEIVRNDGSTIRGELVGYDKSSGFYFLQIGCFKKKIHESEINEIREIDGSRAQGNTGTTVTPIKEGGGRSAKPDHSIETKAMASGAKGATAPLKGADLQTVLSQINNLKAGNPALGALLQMQQKAGGASPLSPAAISPGMSSQLQQQSKALAPLLARFKDRNFQQQLIENVKKMRRALNVNGKDDVENDPSIKQLETLFERLNSLNRVKGRQP